MVAASMGVMILLRRIELLTLWSALATAGQALAVEQRFAVACSEANGDSAVQAFDIRAPWGPVTAPLPVDIGSSKRSQVERNAKNSRFPP